MIIHSIIPMDVIMDSQSTDPVCDILTISEGLMETKRDGDKIIINRIISTNLKAYLNPAYTPGATYQKPND